jgi:Golgi nucleoside diphosphatase
MRSLFFSLLSILILSGFSPVQSSANPIKKKGTVIVLVTQLDEEDDANVLRQIYNTLVDAKQIAEELNVEILTDNENVEDAFVFGVQSIKSDELITQILDDQGAPVGLNQMTIVQGKNFRSLDVSQLVDGDYSLVLKNKDGKEKTKKFTIQKSRVNFD